ncbi:MAG: DUF1849 family protein [Rhodospirillaceae bacterium]|nr:DUF1849 family protein [Rhodospirillaceae bacterium]
MSLCAFAHPRSLSALWLAPLGGALVSAAATAPAAAQTIMPHRAAYEASLNEEADNGPVEDVAGRMVFEWQDVCEGWTIAQTYQLTLVYSGGNETDISSRYATYESRDGTSFTYDMQDRRNGVTESHGRGSAELDGSPGAGRASMRLPEAGELNLPPGTWFPTAHSLEILRRAEAGERIFTATLFDGSAEIPLTEITTVIGTEIPADPEAEDPLRTGPSWPVVLAHFDPATQDSEPLYEVSFVLFASGFVDHMVVNYGEFAIDLTAVASEPLPADCAED